MATDDELALYYAGLLILQYANRPNAIATIKAQALSSIASQIIQQVTDAYDLDTAIGPQLETLGDYRGAKRTLVGLDLSKQYFAMPPYSDPAPASYKGFAVYGQVPSWFFEVYQDNEHATFVLNDNDLRSFIKYLAKLQSLNLELEGIDDFLFEFFGTYVTLADNGDMTITYTHDSADPNDLFAIVSFVGALPHPAGVAVIVLTV